MSDSPKLPAISVLLFTLLSHALPAWAGDIIDVYGVTPIESQRIIKNYAKAVSQIEMQLSKVFADGEQGNEHPELLNALFEKKQQLIQTIKKAEHFAFVDFQTINYPTKADIYTTIEIIKDSHSPRLKFVSPPQSTAYPQVKPDLISEMMSYHQKAMRLMMTQQIDLKDNSCPVYYCSVPFKHPELKPYLRVFNQGIKQHKTEVIHALNHDPNPERRAAAAFLIGHLNDPHEIVAILLPHIRDSNSGVRNNVLRVIGQTILRAKIYDVDARPFMALLDSPFVTDRNKSLITLYTLVDSTEGKKQIAAHNHGKLEALAALKQPNNHDMAVDILNKIKRK